MKLLALALLLLPSFTSASPLTDLPFQCSATEGQRGGEFVGKRSSRQDWARSSALEACRAVALDPASCAIQRCNFETDEPLPSPEPHDPSFCFNTVQCPVDFVCVSQRCVDPSGVGNRCSRDADCGAPSRCVGGKCL